jgi:hypothetical protein
MSDKLAFEKAVKLLRLGRTSTIEIVSEIEEIGCLDKPSWEILAAAGAYLKELQNRAFDEAVDSFQKGDSQLEIERRLRALGFSPWDSQVVAGRAKAKADAGTQEAEQ